MIVDTSALVAILADEPERRRFVQLLAASPVNRISAGSWIELCVVCTRKLDLHGPTTLRRVARDLDLVIEPVTTDQATIGVNAYTEFGVGSRHAARLNFGDCFAYALAKATGEPLLFKGDDFAATDIVAAI